MNQISKLPDEIRNAQEDSVFADNIDRSGGMIPLAQLIPMIISGLSALPEIGKTIYNIVKGNGVEVDEISNKDLLKLIKERI